jgi:ankyrin
MLKFSHLPEQIFQKLDHKGLFKCREVARSWQEVIDERNYPWLCIVNIPTTLQNGNTYLHLAAATGQIEAFKIAFSEEKDKNIMNEHNQTSFHLACMRGRIAIVQLLLLKNNDLKIDINAEDDHGIDVLAKTKFGDTAFFLACILGHSGVAKVLMENADVFSIDLNDTIGTIGLTVFHWTCFYGQADVVKIFMENAAALSIDLNSQSEYGWTAFHMACRAGRIDVVKCFIDNAATLNIDLNIKSLKGKTAFHSACEKSHQDIIQIFLENAAALNIDLNVKSLWKILSLHPNVNEKPGACFPLNFGP